VVKRRADPGVGEAPLDPIVREGLAPLGRALAAYAAGDTNASLLVHIEGDAPEPLPAAYFFRVPQEMGAVDLAALERANGRVLDLGAAAGAHAVPLLERGLVVTAIDGLPEAVEILRARGVADARLASVWGDLAGGPFDTILALMNGTSLAGTPARLGPLLAHLGSHLATGGQILIDSTDLQDESEESADGAPERAAADVLGGFDEQAPDVDARAGTSAAELHYQLDYAGERGPPFPQLFLGADVLAAAAASAGLASAVIATEGPRYLARLTKAPG
jgi:SAM-dependent methyltransferase